MQKKRYQKVRFSSYVKRWSFESPVTANVIKSSWCIEKEQKMSMENYLIEAEGSV